jgi:hypothetical protein
LPDRTREKEHDWLSLIALSQERRSTEQARQFDVKRPIVLTRVTATQARLRAKARRMGRASTTQMHPDRELIEGLLNAMCSPCGGVPLRDTPLIPPEGPAAAHHLPGDMESLQNVVQSKVHICAKVSNHFRVIPTKAAGGHSISSAFRKTDNLAQQRTAK